MPENEEGRKRGEKTKNRRKAREKKNARAVTFFGFSRLSCFDRGGNVDAVDGISFDKKMIFGIFFPFLLFFCAAFRRRGCRLRVKKFFGSVGVHFLWHSKAALWSRRMTLGAGLFVKVKEASRREMG